MTAREHTESRMIMPSGTAPSSGTSTPPTMPGPSATQKRRMMSEMQALSRSLSQRTDVQQQLGAVRHGLAGREQDVPIDLQ